MKWAFVIFVAAVAGMACAAISRSGEPRGICYTNMKIRIYQNDQHEFEITEDALLFSSRFAKVYYAEYHLNRAEQKQLAVAVAKTIANFLGSTNDIRIVHWEQPNPASTNLVDRIKARLEGDWVMDEIVPVGSVSQ